MLREHRATVLIMMSIDDRLRRLAVLELLKPGWFNDAIAINDRARSLVISIMQALALEHLTLPAIFPTLSGGISLEWIVDVDGETVHLDVEVHPSGELECGSTSAACDITTHDAQIALAWIKQMLGEKNDQE